MFASSVVFAGSSDVDWCFFAIIDADWGVYFSFVYVFVGRDDFSLCVLFEFGIGAIYLSYFAN